VSAAYVTNVNIVHVGNVAVIDSVDVVNVRYVNQSVRGAMMVVPHDAFVGSRRVSEVAVVVPQEQIVRARVIGSTAPMAPVRESVLARPPGGAAVRVPPQSLSARQVVVSHQPPPPPVSFANKERALQSNGGRPLDAGQTNSLRRNAPDRNPAVRTPNPPGGGAGRPDAVRPEVNRPPNNDRPPGARPAVSPQQPERQPEVRPAEPRPSEAKPAEQKPNETRPAARPNDKKAPPKKGNEQTQKR
jgi:hypothetical protein